jgi:hypothetical protein
MFRRLASICRKGGTEAWYIESVMGIRAFRE